MPLYPDTKSTPSFIAPDRLYSLSRFLKDSGISYTRLQLARRLDIPLTLISCGRRKYVRGYEGIDFIERLAEYEAKHREIQKRNKENEYYVNEF